ncbi:hypothetical protein EDO6_02489 [Paenibacillus xylanexedens]|nr:hypothetical protein EDO6_02489 [Paenibacillus xylanexedens]
MGWVLPLTKQDKKLAKCPRNLMNYQFGLPIQKKKLNF